MKNKGLIVGYLVKRYSFMVYAIQSLLVPAGFIS